MSNARDQFADDIYTADRLHKDDPVDLTTHYSYVIADELIEAGYRMPRTITTIGTMPNKVGSVLLTAHGKVMVLMPGVASQNHWQAPGSAIWWSPLVEWLPATVLHEPEPQP